MNPIEEPPGPKRLPGVGEVLDLADEDGATLSAVRRKDGVVELHHAGRTVALRAPEASALGAFLTGHYVLTPALLERMASVRGGLTFDWVRVLPGSHADGRTIAELGVRRATGVTVVAILRGVHPLVDPDPDVRLAAGDDLVVAGRPEDRDRLERFLSAGGA